MCKKMFLLSISILNIIKEFKNSNNFNPINYQKKIFKINDSKLINDFI